MIKYHVYSNRGRYGIKAVENGLVIKRAVCVFESETEAIEFAELCAALKLSPLHLDDVSEDILFEKLHR